jgi:hypothetical protein
VSEVNKKEAKKNEKKNFNIERLPLETITAREYLRAMRNENEDGSKQKIFEPIISALVSLKNIEIEQMNTQLKSSKAVLCKNIFFNIN